jgi:hypothetical protein
MERIELTEEMRGKLLGLLPYETDQPFDFVPPCYDPVPNVLRPVFVLRGLTDSARKRVQSYKAKGSFSEDEASEVVRAHLVGWRNLVNLTDGNEISFEAGSDGCASQKSIRVLPQTPKGEILLHLLRCAGLTEPDKRAFAS